jgi:predicted AAA+ superfamily ATPase
MTLVRRDILDRIIPWLDEPQIIFIKGARRSGKTTLLQLIRKELEKKGKKVAYLAVDQLLREPFWQTSRIFEAYLKSEFDFSEDAILYLMLDEVQYLPDSGLFLKTAYDSLVGRLKLVVTSSSALELSKTREFLPGRKVEFVLERFSFLEFCRTKFSPKGKLVRQPVSNWIGLSDFNQIYQNRLQEAFLEYLTWGGYPEVVLQELSEKKAVILRNILNTYLEKDVAGFLRLVNISGFNNLVRILASQVGQLANKKEISSTLGMHFQTLTNYMDMLTGTFIFDFVRPFFRNVRKEMTKMPKVYARDLGIVQYVLTRRSREYEVMDGHLVENFVYRHLLEDNVSDDIHFYRTRGGGEVDFVAGKGGMQLIEVKFRKGVNKIPHSMRNFVENYGSQVEQQIIITQDILARNGDIFFIPAPLFPFVDFWK